MSRRQLNIRHPFRPPHRRFGRPGVALVVALGFGLGVMILPAEQALAQAQVSEPRHPGEWAWKPVTRLDGLDMRYVFYSAADSRNDGVVIRLLNERGTAIRYRFTVIFAAEDGSRFEAPVSGRLEAQEIVTGDAAGLFWIPFKDGRSVARVGVRGLLITPADQ